MTVFSATFCIAKAEIGWEQLRLLYVCLYMYVCIQKAEIGWEQLRLLRLIFHDTYPGAVLITRPSTLSSVH